MDSVQPIERPKLGGCLDQEIKERIKTSALSRFKAMYAPLGATSGRIRSDVQGFFCHIHLSKGDIKVEYDPLNWDLKAERVFFDF